MWQVDTYGHPGNTTNSKNPVALESRVFIGNLNTVKLNKIDVEHIFSKYGIPTGISLHKGYGFVQYQTPAEARYAVDGEHGKMYASQVIDCNVVADKNKKTALKRQASDKCLKSNGSQGIKQACVSAVSSNSEDQIYTTQSTADLYHYSDPDVLICGNCKQMFPSLDALILHKKKKCILKFQCKCEEKAREPSSFQCATCDSTFTSCWELCKHCQTEHQLQLYKETEEIKSLQSFTPSTSSEERMTVEQEHIQNEQKEIWQLSPLNINDEQDQDT